MNKFTKQCVAAFASLAMAGTLCVAGAVVANTSAWAAASACDVSKAPWDQTDKNCTGKITINKWKYEGDNVKQTHVNAKFKITKVTQILGSDNNKKDLNLTSQEDWLAVAAKVPALNTNPKDTTTNITLDTKSTEKDTTNGVAVFDGLGIGLYKVEEVSVDNGYEKLANPFFMTVPEITRKSDAKNNTYTYEVSVDPKNAYTKDAIDKTVDTTGMVGAKDEVPYEIKASAITTSNTPAANYTKDDFKDYAVWDDVPTNAYEAKTDAVTEVWVGTKNLTTDNASKNYYTVEAPVAGNGTNGIDNGYSRLKITFNDAGLTEIATQRKTNYDVKVTVKLKFTLKSDVSAGDVVNKYGFQQGHNKSDLKPEPKNPTPDPKSKVTLRDFQIKKVDGTDPSKTLAKAKFAIFAKLDDAKACAADKDRAAANCDNKSTKGFANEATGTAANGLTTAFKAKVGKEFYVVETAAPDNFALSPAVEKVTIPANQATTTAYVYDFKDVPTKDGGFWFSLPKTGAAGVIIFALAGMCLVAVGMFIFLRNRKKDEEQQAA
ncbi:SpaH/EbpB family LPXTG-anchored major pilin [Gardnerella sp. DNF01192]|uniref:SpaH/EbpB family LPXTG-anchored major pilin n=1 Tax=Gardnerella sp. DNF01192 TaxID=2749064 RepID=UPI003BA8DB0F